MVIFIYTSVISIMSVSAFTYHSIELLSYLYLTVRPSFSHFFSALAAIADNEWTKSVHQSLRSTDKIYVLTSN